MRPPIVKLLKLLKLKLLTFKWFKLWNYLMTLTDPAHSWALLAHPTALSTSLGCIPDICHGHRDGVRGEKSVMWRNFKFLYMTDVEKSEISFIMCTIYGILLHFTLFCFKKFSFLRFTLFFAKLVCCNLRAIVWRKF